MNKSTADQMVSRAACLNPANTPSDYGASRSHRDTRGFTLVELLVVVSILGILAVIFVSMFTSITNFAKQSRAMTDVRFLDTVCRPTKERQDAAVELARASDVVIVIGGKTSNNTRELVKTCGRYCSRVHHVQTEADLSPAWFREAHSVGLTAGTSTPDDVIDRVEGRIRTFGHARGLDALDLAGCAR